MAVVNAGRPGDHQCHRHRRRLHPATWRIPAVAPRMLTSRGTHIVLKESLCPEGLGLLVPSTDDGRVLFMLPFFGRTLVGTTDQACLSEAATLASDPRRPICWTTSDAGSPAASATVTSRWAGGRPLLKPAGEGLDSSRVVREHEVETLPCGLVSVMGGKWTTCRPMALDTLEAVAKQLGRNRCRRPEPFLLIGAPADPTATLSGLETSSHGQLAAKLPDTPLRDLQLDHLQANHGLQALPLIETADPGGPRAAQRRNPGVPSGDPSTPSSTGARPQCQTTF